MIIVGTFQLKNPALLFNIQKKDVIDHITFITENYFLKCGFAPLGKMVKKR